MTKTAIIFGWDVRTVAPGNPARDRADEISSGGPEEFMKIFYEGVDKIKATGVDLDVVFIIGTNSDGANIDIITAALAKKTYDVVLVGNGLRGLPDVRFFEKAVNAVHKGAPMSRIVFNNTPFDNPETIARGFE